MDFPKDPISGRNFDGHYDDLLSCGCVIFYHGGISLCEDHAWKKAQREEQELAVDIEKELNKSNGS